MLFPSGIVSSKGSTGVGLPVAILLQDVESLPKNEAMQQQAKLNDASSLYLDGPFELMDLVFLKQVYSSLEMFGKKTDGCLSLVLKALKLPSVKHIRRKVMEMGKSCPKFPFSPPDLNMRSQIS